MGQYPYRLGAPLAQVSCSSVLVNLHCTLTHPLIAFYPQLVEHRSYEPKASGSSPEGSIFFLVSLGG